MPDQVELIARKQALADKHLVEGGANCQDVRGGDQAFACLIRIRSGAGDRAAHIESSNDHDDRGACDDEAEDSEH